MSSRSSFPAGLACLVFWPPWATHQCAGLYPINHIPIIFHGQLEVHGRGEVSAGQRVDRSVLRLLLGTSRDEHLPVRIRKHQGGVQCAWLSHHLLLRVSPLPPCRRSPPPSWRSHPWLSPRCLSTFHRKGRFLFQYDNYGSTAEDIMEWLKK